MISPSTWEKVVQHNGMTREEGLLNGDPFAALAQQAHAWKEAGYEPARVNVTASNSLDYGQGKVSVLVSIACPQTEQHIQMATEAGFLKALEMVNEASDTIGIPALERPY